MEKQSKDAGNFDKEAASVEESWAHVHLLLHLPAAVLQLMGEPVFGGGQSMNQNNTQN